MVAAFSVIEKFTELREKLLRVSVHTAPSSDIGMTQSAVTDLVMAHMSWSHVCELS